MFCDFVWHHVFKFLSIEFLDWLIVYVKVNVKVRVQWKYEFRYEYDGEIQE